MNKYADDAVTASVNDYGDDTEVYTFLKIPQPSKDYNPFNDTIAPFQKGDIVVLTSLNAHAPQEVMGVRRANRRDSVSGWEIQCRYTREYSGQPVDQLERWRRSSDYKRYNHDPNFHDYTNKVPGPELGKFKFKHEENKMSKLYQTLEETPRFGTFLAKNSAGQIVLEMKGDGNKVEAFDADKLEEVKPYTVSVLMLIGTNKNNVSFEAAKGRVKEGDHLLFSETGEQGIVTGINTGATGRIPQLPEKLRRYATEEI